MAPAMKHAAACVPCFGMPDPLPCLPAILSTGALHGVVLAAGTACMAAVAGSGDRDAATVFYSCPTATVTQFFQQIAAAAAPLGRSPGRAAGDHVAVVQLARGLTTAVSGALAQRGQQQQFFPAALNAAVAGIDEPELAAGADVRIALAALADACCRWEGHGFACCWRQLAAGWLLLEACFMARHLLSSWLRSLLVESPLLALQAAAAAGARGAAAAAGERAAVV